MYRHRHASTLGESQMTPHFVIRSAIALVVVIVAACSDSKDNPPVEVETPAGTVFQATVHRTEGGFPQSSQKTGVA